MESTICFKQLAQEIENIKFLQEKKQKEFNDIEIISNSFSGFSINNKKKGKSSINKAQKNKAQKNEETNINLLSPKFNGIKKRKLFKNISKYEIKLLLNPKNKKQITHLNNYSDKDILEIILKLPKLIEDSCYQSLIDTRSLLPLNINSLFKKCKNTFRKDNFQMYINLKNHLLISIFILSCKYLDNLKNIKPFKNDTQLINQTNELYFIYSKNEIKQLNTQIHFMFYQIEKDIIIDSENETYNDLDDYSRNGLQLLKLITFRIIKIMKKNEKIEDMKFKDRLDLMTMIFNFCCYIQYLLYRF